MSEDDRAGEFGPIYLPALQRICDLWLELEPFVEAMSYDDVVAPTELQISLSDGLGDAESARLEQSVAELEQRYETITSQSNDAVAVVQNETFVYWNQRLSDLTGYDNSEINTFYPALDLFHPADRGFIEEWYAGAGRRQSHEARLVTEQGASRTCKITATNLQWH